MTEIYTIKQLIKLPKYRWLTEAALRQLIFQAGNTNSADKNLSGNGLQQSGAILRIGRKVLIDAVSFDAWI
jgi:hypothetical protein